MQFKLNGFYAELQQEEVHRHLICHEHHYAESTRNN